MKRYQIKAKVESKLALIDKLNAEILELRRQNCLLTDKNQQFVEENEEVLVSNRPKKFETKLIGRVHFVQGFKDEDTGEVVKVQRKLVVRINGEWV